MHAQRSIHSTPTAAASNYQSATAAAAADAVASIHCAAPAANHQTAAGVMYMNLDRRTQWRGGAEQW